MKDRKVYQRLAELIAWNPTDAFVDQRQAEIDEIMSNSPSGSGIDSGTKLNPKTKPEKLVFDTEYHHMTENGFYDGWTNHQVIVEPSLTCSFKLKVTGQNRNDIKDYLYDVYASWLNSTI